MVSCSVECCKLATESDTLIQVAGLQDFCILVFVSGAL